MKEIQWKENMGIAVKEAQSTGKYLFLFFHHPKCGGCRKTMEYTFIDPDVVELLNRDFISLSFLVTEEQDLTARYKVEWTPTFIITDIEGRELERWVGYLPPVDFISQAYLSEGLSEFHRSRFKEAEKDFEWIIDHTPDSPVAPQARYYMGVALYKETGDARHLTRTWEAMNKHYPGHEWTKKASAWSS